MMPQITLDLDDATQALVDQAAEANGISKSRRVAKAIGRCAAHEWPQGCLNLAGSFPDFPLVGNSANHAQPADTPCVTF